MSSAHAESQVRGFFPDEQELIPTDLSRKRRELSGKLVHTGGQFAGGETTS